MSAMARRILLGVFVAGMLAFASLAIPSHAHGQDVKQHLRDQYQGKIFVLRGFPVGDVLHYDSSGTSDSAASGDWTTDGFVQINDIHLSDDRLIVKAQRMAVGWSEKDKFEIHPLERQKSHGDGKEPVGVKISADSGMHNPSPEQIDEIVSKIFLTAQDSLADLVPDYWKPCVSRGLKGTDKVCAFAPEMLTIPGVAVTDNKNELDLPGKDVNLEVGLYSIGKGVSPPRPTFQRNPEFSERARVAKYQGTVILSLVVNRDGNATNIRISRPLGYGLDAKAVGAVQGWKFTPAEKDGGAVATQIMVEVDFHLY